MLLAVHSKLISQLLQHQEERHWGFGDNLARIHGPAYSAFKDF